MAVQLPRIPSSVGSAGQGIPPYSGSDTETTNAAIHLAHQIFRDGGIVSIIEFTFRARNSREDWDGSLGVSVDHCLYGACSHKRIIVPGDSVADSVGNKIWSRVSDGKHQPRSYRRDFLSASPSM
ncbi:hypothetical protein PoMZ_12227 [Pyricularia oryzae]|uniref:Uncharacterized protein n=1 Tax=Pyricularia oryzae TaxID=318829 RepID=A0A4P7NML0_PYROR|nr:hypothetical protein PoMZ_12227 [Pyricularia oryzae]